MSAHRTLQRMVVALTFLAVAAAACAQTAPPPYTPKSPDDHALSQSEANSIAYMKTLFYNQREYKKKMNRYAASLMALTGGGRSFTKRMARPDRGDYVVGYHGGKDSFSVTLTPKQFAPTRRAFYMDSSGAIRVQADAPATAESEPLK
ncbi:MAG: hypothetical protein HYX28_00015 [Candidatus Koribacter versatilis]|uniref:Lipoprotein n=1 Tax=Candidatus Korobacter versatilis TaxID=658062 RepID=A0A932A5W8_9BACT|nr:hypothetical protein [Candidatus Koribacter versatilis]